MRPAMCIHITQERSNNNFRVPKINTITAGTFY